MQTIDICCLWVLLYNWDGIILSANKFFNYLQSYTIKQEYSAETTISGASIDWEFTFQSLTKIWNFDKL